MIFLSVRFPPCTYMCGSYWQVIKDSWSRTSEKRQIKCMANQCEYTTTLGLVSDAFLLCYMSSRRISWTKWDCHCCFVHLYVLVHVSLIWHCIIEVLKPTQKKIQAVHLTWTHQVLSGVEISNCLLAKKDKKNNSETWREMLLDMLFYMHEYLKTIHYG